MLGRLADAAELLDAATEAARLSGNPQALAWALFCRAFVAFPAGDTRTAIAAAQESLDLATEAGQSVIAARAAAVLAVALLDAGEPARAAETLAGPTGEDFAAIPVVWRAYFLELMTRYWLALGRRDDAERAAAGAQASAAAVGLAADRDGPPRGGRRRPGRRRRRRRPSTAAWRRRRSPTPSARRSKPASPGPSPAARWRTSAGATTPSPSSSRPPPSSDRCGAVRYRDAAERELRQLGQHIHRRTRPGDPDQRGVGSLTERELQIAMLIVDRKTNAEIAGELFLSKKTVETHIRNMFRKLDASSRVEVARAVERARPVTD